RPRTRLAGARAPPAAGDASAASARRTPMSAEHPTTRSGRRVWSAMVGIDDGREPWADTIASEEYANRLRAKQWIERTIRSARALERLRQTQGKDGNRPLLVATLEAVCYRPVAFTDPACGLVEDTAGEPIDGTQATAYLRADHVTVVWDEPERGHQGGGGRER